MCRITWGIRDGQADEQERERENQCDKQGLRHLYQTKLIIARAVMSILLSLTEELLHCEGSFIDTMNWHFASL